jgi:hypothetical protein
VRGAWWLSHALRHTHPRCDAAGSRKYGAPEHAPKPLRSRQGKMEKSLINFHANHPDCEWDDNGTALLSHLRGFQHEQTGPRPFPLAGDSLVARGLGNASRLYAPRVRKLMAKSPYAPAQGYGIGGAYGIGGVDAGASMAASALGGIGVAASTTLGPANSMRLSALSLAMPLGSTRYMGQANFFYWLDRVSWRRHPLECTAWVAPDCASRVSCCRVSCVVCRVVL